MSREESAAVTDYLEQMALLPGSGEYALSKILELGAWARKPLAEQLATVTVPMVFYYGTRTGCPQQVLWKWLKGPMRGCILR